MNFKEWLEGKENEYGKHIRRPSSKGDMRPVVSFDFDGVLHRDIYPGTHHPLSHYNPDMTPNMPMHQKLREEARQNKVVVTSARCPDTIPIMQQFIQNYHLPVQEIVATCDGPKLPYLQRMQAIRHYDDNSRVGIELQGSGIEFVLVRVKSSMER